MRFRELRMAWSVACGLACVLLIVLWERSYRMCEWAEIPIGKTPYSIQAMTGVGTLYFNVAPAINPGYSHETNDELPGVLRDYHGRNEHWINRQPFWLVSAAVATLGVVPWIGCFRWRFSLRTLLIVTTLVAVVLGLIVAVLRWPAD
jgi:hypothetical protein